MALFLCAVVGCDRGTQEARAASRSGATELKGEALATVNGVPITELDVEQRLRSGAHDPKAAEPSRQAVLENVISEELVLQRGLELGLDRDPSYRKKIGAMQAALDAAKRREMVELYFEREVRTKAKVTDAEARAYFDQRAKLFQHDLHIWQILYKGDRAAAERARGEIQAGQAFDRVAAKRFPALPASVKPWDLGFLHWNQMPEPWLDVVYKLKSGEVSAVIEGSDGRYWVLKVVGVRDNANASFEQAKPRIVSVLEREKVAQRRRKLEAELRAKARIVKSE